MVILGTYYISKLYPIYIFDGLNSKYEREKRVKDDSKYFVQNKWNNEVDIC